MSEPKPKFTVTLDQLRYVVERSMYTFLNSAPPAMPTKEMQAFLFCKGLEEYLLSKGVNPGFTIEMKDDRKA